MRKNVRRNRVIVIRRGKRMAIFLSRSLRDLPFPPRLLPAKVTKILYSFARVLSTRNALPVAKKFKNPSAEFVVSCSVVEKP